MNCSYSIVHSHGTSALSFFRADFVGNLEASSINRLYSIFAGKSMLIKHQYDIILAEEGLFILKSINFNLFLFVLGQTSMTGHWKRKVLIEINWSLELHNCVVVWQLSTSWACLEFLREFPCSYLVILLSRSVDSQIKLEVCVLTTKFFIENVVSCGYKNVCSNQESTAFALYLIFIAKGYASNGSM